MTYLPSAGDPALFKVVADATACGSSTNAFYVDGDVLHLCPDTCTRVEADPRSELTVQAMCL